jgi:hypothetical protein
MQKTTIFVTLHKILQIKVAVKMKHKIKQIKKIIFIGISYPHEWVFF